MLVIKNGTLVQLADGVNFWFHPELDCENNPIHKIANSKTFVLVLDHRIGERGVLYKVLFGSEIGWVVDGLLICGLYGYDFFWTVYDPHILKKAFKIQYKISCEKQ
jgi:hypothetical protein